MAQRNLNGLTKNLSTSPSVPNTNTTSIKKNSIENPKNDQEKKKNSLTNSLNLMSNGKKSEPTIDSKVKSIYPSELKPLDNLISKTNIKFGKALLERFPYYRDVGLNIYEALSFGYVEEIFKTCTIQYIANFIELIRTPEFHVLTNPDLLSKNKKISKELKQKYLFSQNQLITLFEGYLDTLLNDEQKRYHVIYDFYYQCSKSEEIKLSCNALIRGVAASYYSENRQLLNDSYKIYNLEETTATISEFDIITNVTDIIIELFEGSKNNEIKIKRYKYGVEKTNGNIYILSYGVSFYLLFEKDQKVLLEKEIIQGYLKKKESYDKNKQNEEKIKEKEDKIMNSNKIEKPDYKNDINLNSSNSQIKGDNKFEEKKQQSINDKPSEFFQSCDKCMRKTYKKPLFTIKSCQHLICFDCMLKFNEISRYSQHEYHLCPLHSCSYRISDEDIQEYFNQIQISESITMSTMVNSQPKPQSQSEDNVKKKFNELESEPSVIDLEPKIKCILCHSNTPQSEIYTNPGCYHCFCHDCVSKKLIHYKSYNYCPERRCDNTIYHKNIEKFLHDFLSRDAKKNLIEVLQDCYSCKKLFKISMAIGTDFDFFQCKSCKVTSCLIHCAPLNNCFCSCEVCNIKTECDWMKASCRVCPDCKRKFCLLCKESLSKCNCYCEQCGTIQVLENDQLVCKNCEERCSVCGVKTNKRTKLIGIKCGHTYCRSCAYNKFPDFAKESCLKKSY